MDKFEHLYRTEKEKNEQLEARLTQMRNDYEHLKAVHEILIHRIRIIADGVGR